MGADDGLRTLLRCQSGRRSRVCLRRSRRCEFPLRQVQALKSKGAMSANVAYDMRTACGQLSCARIEYYIPTVAGFIRTPSSMCAFAASSASKPDRTFLPQSVFTKVVRPM